MSFMEQAIFTLISDCPSNLITHINKEICIIFTSEPEKLFSVSDGPIYTISITTFELTAHNLLSPPTEHRDFVFCFCIFVFYYCFILYYIIVFVFCILYKHRILLWVSHLIVTGVSSRMVVTLSRNADITAPNTHRTVISVQTSPRANL